MHPVPDLLIRQRTLFLSVPMVEELDLQMGKAVGELFFHFSNGRFAGESQFHKKTVEVKEIRFLFKAILPESGKPMTLLSKEDESRQPGGQKIKNGLPFTTVAARWQEKRAEAEKHRFRKRLPACNRSVGLVLKQKIKNNEQQHHEQQHQGYEMAPPLRHPLHRLSFVCHLFHKKTV